MAFDLQEQEQIDSARAFWQQWGKWIAAVVILVCLGYLGFKGWQMYQNQQSEDASAIYTTLEQSVTQGKFDQVAKVSTQLQTEYPSTVYASRASLLAAKVAFEKNDLKLAATQLKWVIEHSKEADVKAVAQLRLAAVYLDQKQYDLAMSTLQAEHPEAFDPLFMNARGDIFAIKGDVKGAKDAYRSALVKLPQQSPLRQLVQIKLDGLGA